jgi:hypothetical protein
LTKAHGIQLLAEQLLFDDDQIPFVIQCTGIKLNTAYMPPLTRSPELGTKLLEQPQPDHAVGYMPAGFARQSGPTPTFCKRVELALYLLCTSGS